jgi:hypothetical protein
LRSSPSIERGEQLLRERHGARRLEHAIGDDRLEVSADQQLHRKEQPVIGCDVSLVNANHVGMVDPSNGLDLLDEQMAIVCDRIDPRPDHLDRDVAIDGQLASAVHGARGAGRDCCVEPELSG